ncbi:MAG TPA: M64 family metallopeptidase [Bacteroidales bacterium]|nr:M64 family metallopeptidase [Bacteroidales bacterium]
MKKLVIFLFLSGNLFGLKARDNFNTYFEPNTLRFDYIQAGDAENANIYFSQLRRQKGWAGPRDGLIDPFRYGEYMLEVFDSVSNRLIFSHGYSSLFAEWQTVPEARELSRSFYESVLMPFPKNTIRIVIYKRNRSQAFEWLYEQYVNPHSKYIAKDRLYDFPVKVIRKSGDPSRKVDLLILPEGYTAQEMDKFVKDAKRFDSLMFDWSPYKNFKQKFNVSIIEAPSAESGTDFPGADTWKNTLFNSGFNTFGLERYLMTTDMKTIRDVAAEVPYDQIYILVNTAKYGGGGIYNFYNVCTSDNKYSEEVFMHEFGHGFACLADEYYTSDVAYTDYYDLSTEPYQPNITTLVRFDTKWQDMIKPGVPVPTPEIPAFDSVVGVFEGGGYAAKNVYRPMINCTMKSNIRDGFCPVCQKAIVDMIHYYTR